MSDIILFIFYINSSFACFFVSLLIQLVHPLTQFKPYKNVINLSKYSQHKKEKKGRKKLTFSPLKNIQNTWFLDFLQRRNHVGHRSSLRPLDSQSEWNVALTVEDGGETLPPLPPLLHPPLHWVGGVWGGMRHLKFTRCL